MCLDIRNIGHPGCVRLFRGELSLQPVIYQTPGNEESNIVSNSDLSRRDFVALMGAGAALTGMPVTFVSLQTDASSTPTTK